MVCVCDKVGCDKVVCERWCVCVTKLGVTKLVCDKVVCDKVVCERWDEGGRNARTEGWKSGRDTEAKTRSPYKDVGQVVFERDGLTCSVDVTKCYACQAKRRLM